MTNRVREIRRSLGLRQSDIARRGGVALRTVCAVERGERCLVPTQRKILRALGLPFAQRAEVFPGETLVRIGLRPDPADPTRCLVAVEPVEQEPRS